MDKDRDILSAPVKALKRRFHKSRAKALKRTARQLLAKAYVYGDITAKRRYDKLCVRVQEHRYLSVG